MGRVRKRDSAIDLSNDVSGFLDGINHSKLAEGDKKEFNEAVRRLNEIDYKNLNDDDKKKVENILNEVKDFNFKDIKVKVDSGKLGDMIEAVGADNIDPSVLGTLSNYADLKGREDVVVLTMITDPGKMSKIIENMDNTTISKALHAVLNDNDKDYILRLDESMGSKAVANLFINSNMDAISNEDISFMMTYFKQKNIEVNPKVMVNILNKKDLDIKACFGSDGRELTDVINKVDLSQVDLSKKLAKGILNDINIEKIEATKLVKIINKADIKEGDFSSKKIGMAIEKVESLGNSKNRKLIESMKALKAQQEKLEAAREERFDVKDGFFDDIVGLIKEGKYKEAKEKSANLEILENKKATSKRSSLARIRTIKPERILSSFTKSLKAITNKVIERENHKSEKNRKSIVVNKRNSMKKKNDKLEI